MRRTVLLALVAVITIIMMATVVSAAPPVTSGFTYQGFLKEGGIPADGNYDFEFRLYDAVSAGSQVGSVVTLDNVFVTDGLFDVVLDFGSGVFDGQARWIAISVRDGDTTDPYTLLTPRRALTAVPYAQYALNGNHGGGAEVQAGQAVFNVQPDFNAKIYTQTVSFNSPFAVNPILTLGLQSTSPYVSGSRTWLQEVSVNNAEISVVFPAATPKVVNLSNNISFTNPAIAIVNGNPAIAYRTSSTSITYVRANDANGETWGTPISIAIGSVIPNYLSLAVVNGKPAIAYLDNTNNDLKYIQASDSTGSTWSNPSITLDSIGVVGFFASLKVVNGFPAISYYDNTNNRLKYIRATNADGSGSWSSPIILDTAGGANTDLEIIDGNPAIAYVVSGGNVKFIRANTSSGSTATDWAASIVIAPGNNFTSLATIGDKPAISFTNSSGFLQYVQATTTTGSPPWGAVITLNTEPSTRYPSLFTTIEGKAAITYAGVTTCNTWCIKYIEAFDNITWLNPVIIESNASNDPVPTPILVNGKPAIGAAVATSSGTFLRFYFTPPVAPTIVNWIATEP